MKKVDLKKNQSDSSIGIDHQSAKKEPTL